MAKQKITRKALLKSPDEFLTFTERALNFIRERARYFHVAGIVLAAAALVYLGVSAYLNHVNKKGQGAYHEAYAELRQEGDPEKAKALFRAVVEDHGLSSVSKLAAPQIGYLKYREKNYEEAAPLYETFLNSSSEKSPYRSLAALALSAAYEEKGELERAIAELRDLASNPENAFMEHALLSLGRLYRLSGKHEKAREVYEEFSGRFTTSPFLAQVKAYLNQSS